MSVYTPNWDKIINDLGSTTTTFGGSWANLISDYYNGVNIGLVDPTKKPKIGTPTLYKFETLQLLDNDESHHVSFSIDDIDSGNNRIIKIRRMNDPFLTDYLALEGSPATFLNKEIDNDVNNVYNIINANIKVGAGITDNKLAQITDKAKLHSSILYNDQDNDLGIHYFDMERLAAAPSNPTGNKGRFYIKQIDANNEGVFYKIKKNGAFVEGQFI